MKLRDSDEILGALGIPPATRVMVAQYVFMKPRTTDPDAQGVMILIAALQQRLGLTPDGYAGPETAAKLAYLAGPEWADRSWLEIAQLAAINKRQRPAASQGRSALGLTAEQAGSISIGLVTRMELECPAAPSAERDLTSRWVKTLVFRALGPDPANRFFANGSWQSLEVERLNVALAKIGSKQRGQSCQDTLSRIFLIYDDLFKVYGTAAEKAAAAPEVPKPGAPPPPPGAPKIPGGARPPASQGLPESSGLLDKTIDFVKTPMGLATLAAAGFIGWTFVKGNGKRPA